MAKKKSSQRKAKKVQASAPVEITFEIFQKAFNDACKSTPIKATRRIFFNHLDESVGERGFFYVDQMYGSGSGVLIKHDYTFYLLTADHVIANATSYSFTNESPFWTPSQADQYPEELDAFLMPAQIIHIGEASPSRGHCFESQDLVLVELFFPSVKHMPDKFIDLDASPEILATSDGFYRTQFLLAAGYPFETNHFEFFEEETPGGTTHSTRVNRWIVDGICDFDQGDPIMTRKARGGTFPNLSGASGGIVTNIPAPGDDVKMLGMLVSAGSEIARFIPSYVIAEALSNKAIARVTAVDPAFDNPPPLEMRKLFLDLLGHGTRDGLVNPGAT
jgi:hypothetical protein